MNECHGNDKLPGLDDWVSSGLPRLIALFIEGKRGKRVNKRLAWQKRRKGCFVGEKLVFATSDEFTQAWQLDK